MDVPNVAIDHTHYDRILTVHECDREPVSTGIAVAILDAALAAGHPHNAGAASSVLKGPAAAAAAQGSLTGNPGLLDRVVEHDEAAHEHALLATDEAAGAEQAVQELHLLPQESVAMADGSTLTRGQVAAGQVVRQAAAADRESRGDFDHLAGPPIRVLRIFVATVLSGIESFLLIAPVTNVSWTDPLAVAALAGIVGLFVLMNEALPRHCGRAVRDHREQVNAVRENTRIAVSVGRDGDQREGRTRAGQVDIRDADASGRRRTLWCGAFGLVLALYATVMFQRIAGLAQQLWSGPLPALSAAGLVTVFTAGAPVLLAWGWSRGNRLGDQIREFGLITATSHEIAEDLTRQCRDGVDRSLAAAERAGVELVRAEEARQHGLRTIGVGLQKAAALLDQEAVLTPDPQNLFPIVRESLMAAVAALEEAAVSRANALDALEHRPFGAVGPAPDPWTRRAQPRSGRPDPMQLPPHDRDDRG